MAKSSINFKKANMHNFMHNDRSEEHSAKTVFQEYSHINQFNINSTRGKNLFNNLYKNTIKKVVGRVRRANKKNCLWEAVVNIKTNTTMEDLKNLEKFIENKFKFTGLQIAIHRDEGHFEDGKFIVNNHAHMLFFTLDKQSSRQMYRREFVNKSTLRELQDETAKILNMDRGEFVEISKRKRLEHKDYKRYIQEVSKEKVKVKKVNDEIKSLKEELKNQGFEREDFKKIEDKNKELLSLLKEKNLSIEELNYEIKLLKNQLLNKEKKEAILNAENIDLNIKVEDLIYNNEEVRSGLEMALRENKIYEEVVKKYKKDIEELRNKSAMFLGQNQQLNLQIKLLKDELEMAINHNGFDEEIKEIKLKKDGIILEKIPDTSHLKKDAKKRGNLNANKYN